MVKSQQDIVYKGRAQQTDMAHQRIYNRQHFRPGQFFLFGMLLAAAIIVSDQFTKWLVLESMLRTQGTTPAFLDWFFTRQPLEYFIDQRENYNAVTLTPFLNFVMVWNKGISFGLFNNGEATESASNMMPLVFTGLSLMISILMTIWLAMVRRRLMAWSLAFIIGGAIGNAIDRIRFGAVADFVDLHAGGYHWPAFNVADSAIVIGAALLVIDSIVHRDQKGFL